MSQGVECYSCLPKTAWPPTFTIEGQKSHWGDKCSDKFRKPSTTGRKPVIDDLLAYRESVIEELAPKTAPAGSKLLVGIPRAMSMFDRYPFWHRYFTTLGIDVVLSPPTDQKIAADGIELALAQPCYPIQVAHGHALALLNQGVDYLLSPNVLNAESDECSTCIAHFCPWNQTLPYVLQTAPKLEDHQHKFLVPTLPALKMDGARASGLYRTVGAMRTARCTRCADE